MRRTLRPIAAMSLLLALSLPFVPAAAQQQQPVTQPASAPATAPARALAPSKAVLIELEGEVNDYNRNVLFRRFRDAKALGAQTIILEIDTYGGLVTSGLEISRFIKQQRDVHTIAFVRNKAISAGAMIALACDEIIMAPHALLGDSAPIAGGPTGVQPMGETERAKAESPVLEDFRDSAQRNGYNVLLVESMVNTQRAVHYVEAPDGNRKFVDGEQYAKLTSEGWQPVADVRNPVDDKGSLLTVNPELGRKLGLVKQIIATPEALAQERNLNIVAAFRPGIGDQIVAFLASGMVRFFLITILSISLYVALHTPGHGGPEAVALICLGALLGVPLLTGYAQWWEILAILLGLVLVAVELFVLPGFGVAGISGLVLFFVGLLMTFVPKEPGGIPGILPSLAGTWQALVQGLAIILGGLISSLFLWFWLSRYLPQLPYFNRLILTATVGGTPPVDADAASPAALELWPPVGTVGVAITDLRPGGSVSFPDAQLGDQRLADAVSDSGFVAAGTQVTVRQNLGSHVIVRTAKPSSVASGSSATPPSPSSSSSSPEGQPA